MTIAVAPIPGLILAGGRSTRMGSDKAHLPLRGDTILGHVVRRLAPQVEALFLNAAPGFADPSSLPLIPDTIAGQAGPLAGVLAGLQTLAPKGYRSVLTAPCDSPFLPPDLAERLTAACEGDAIVVAESAGRSHPVFALWPTAIADDLKGWLADPDNRRINAFLKRHTVVSVDFPLVKTAAGPLDPFMNLNTPDDLAQAHHFSELLA